MTSYHYNDAEAPEADRIHAGAVIAIFHNGRVLLDLRIDGGWGLIGGALEIGESLIDCARREAAEETGLEIGDLKLLGVFSDPSRVIVRSDKTLQLVTTCFATTIPHADLQKSEESRDLRYFTEAELGSLEIVPTHRVIVPYLFREEKWPILS